MKSVDSNLIWLVWRRGGNWVIFCFLWIVFSAIIGAIENSELNKDLTQEEKEIELTTAARTFLEGTMKPHLLNYSSETLQVDKIINLTKEEGFEKIFHHTSVQDAIISPKAVRIVMIEIGKTFLEISNKMKDEQLKTLANRAAKLLNNNSTISAFSIFGHAINEEQKHFIEKYKNEDHPDTWHMGHSLHFVNTVFTTTGYGARTPITSWGKFITVMMILTQLPLFLYCIITTALDINNFLDKVFRDSTPNYNDLESLTNEDLAEHIWIKKLVIAKGLLVLGSVVLIHLIICAIYHYCTTGWTFGNVLYYQFVSYSTVGFGDLIPTDESTVAGSILKSILIKIPSQIILMTVFLRLIPILI